MKSLHTLASLALLALPALPAAAQGVHTAHAQTLVPDDPSVSPFLGRSMDVSGTTLVTATGGLDPVALVFEKAGGVWQEVAVLEPPSSPPTINWGNAVAVDGQRIAVAGYANNQARAWVYEPVGGVWTLQGTADLPITNSA